MEIKINESFAELTDVDKLDDHKKIFLGVVSEIYVRLERDNYIFFDPHDLFVLIGIKHFDPSQTWAKKNHGWIFDCFDIQYHGYSNVGFLPKKMKGKLGDGVAGPPKHSVTLTDEGAIKMWFYLLGVFSNREVVSDFKLRKRLSGYNAYSFDRSYIAEMNYRLVKRDYRLHDAE